MAIPVELRTLTDAFFASEAHKYDLSHAEGCGQYMEALVPYAQSHGYPKVGHLRKHGSQTQYNGHAVDAFLYNDPVPPSGLLQSVDVIKDAESDHASAGWSIDIPRYTTADWMQSVEPEEPPVDPPANTVPWAPYWGDASSDEMTRTLFYDYSRKPESANFGMGRWLNRCLHSAFMGPEGIPLGPDGALARHRPEWCAVLGLDPSVPVPASFKGICDGVWK